MLLNRQQRLAVKAAKTGVQTYGSVKHAQGALAARRTGRSPLTYLGIGFLLGALTAAAALRKQAAATPPGTPAHDPVAGPDAPQPATNGAGPGAVPFPATS